MESVDGSFCRPPDCVAHSLTHLLDPNAFLQSSLADSGGARVEHRWIIKCLFKDPECLYGRVRLDCFRNKLAFIIWCHRKY